MIIKLYRPIMTLMFLLGGLTNCAQGHAALGILCLCAAAFCLLFPRIQANPAAFRTSRVVSLAALELLMLSACVLQAVQFSGVLTG